MTLLPPGTYHVSLHFLTSHEGRSLLDFSDIATGERHTLSLFPRQVLSLAVAMITQKIELDDVSGGQVVLKVVVKIKGDRAFNAIRSITAPSKLIPFESGVPTPTQLGALPVASFEDFASCN